MPGRWSLPRRLALGAIGPMVVAAPGMAAAQAHPTNHADSAHRGVRDRAELEAYLDGVLTAQLRDKHVAGATVSVVKDGALFFTKGYGYADFDARKPVDPERTLFRIGSVSKLFTWTAVMQLVEQGKLDLDADVNTYLDFKVPATYPEPVRLKNLLTHTPGFEEDSRDLFTEDPAHITPMGRWLPAHMPARVRPPGSFSAYSNYGTALAGYIVQRVSGTPWEEYIEKHILDPLGMRQTTGRQPLPERLASDMSQGYSWNGGRFEAKKFEIITGASPAGSVSASATDMAKFMLAHLGNGKLGDQRILAESTAVRMHTRSFGHDPRLPGWALGFYEKSSHGVRIIGHGGDTRVFHTDLALIPQDGLGVFVSTNTDKGGELSFGPFLEAFLDHYYPDPLAPVKPPADFAAQAARFAGTYAPNRASYTTFQKAFGLAGAVPVTVGDSGNLLIKAPGGVMRLVEVDSMLFRDVVGHELVAFRADPSGRITHAFLADEPMVALERLSWSQEPRLHLVVLGLGLVLFLGTVIAAPVRLLRRRARVAPPPRAVRVGRRFLFGIALANLVFVVWTAVLASDFWALLTGPMTGLKLALALPVLGAVLTLGATASAVIQWKNGVGTVGGRLRYSAAVLISLLFVWSLNSWNLLGWRM